MVNHRSIRLFLGYLLIAQGIFLFCYISWHLVAQTATPGLSDDSKHTGTTPTSHLGSKNLIVEPGKLHVLVTGGAGFIASHAALMLLEHGHTVTTIDNLSRGNMGALKV